MCLVVKSLGNELVKIRNNLITLIKSAITSDIKNLQSIADAVDEIVGGVEYEDEFYRYILDRIVVNDNDSIDVYLKNCSAKWTYTACKEDA